MAHRAAAAGLAWAAVNASSAMLDERLDEVYRTHPGGFVAARDRLVKELRAAGDREAAERVRKLRRPTVAAWLVNRAALSAPKAVEGFAEASRRLEDAQVRALEGGDEGGSEWRGAAAREREAAAAVLAAAEAAAREDGHPATKRALELVDETLRAASADEDLRGRVVAGRVERERSAATLGTPVLADVPRRRAPPAKAREAGRARRELARLERQLADATAREERLRSRADEAADALRRAKEDLADARRRAAGVRRQVKAAQQRADR